MRFPFGGLIRVAVFVWQVIEEHEMSLFKLLPSGAVAYFLVRFEVRGLVFVNSLGIFTEIWNLFLV